VQTWQSGGVNRSPSASAPYPLAWPLSRFLLTLYPCLADRLLDRREKKKKKFWNLARTKKAKITLSFASPEKIFFCICDVITSTEKKKLC
jgi:hypothetical protein